ncbi:polyprenyl synthetase family protein [Trichlorobacter ammonificans]|uniref:Octaprenyl diphosphate synthase n=1 Tax=Trichlorobacter ammonificans TaxID=2916410 RepID=A0ABN8HJQ1_9BACT|nr:polyprenyl synthetase family protein [Trichlorobacter ammonificans]CAH2031130.1 Octaprenyl diphosphate synthase [Trichlorobacter ammonificans]
MQAALELIGDDLRQVEEQFRKDLESDVPLIRKVGEYVLASGGKRIRPAMLLLAARLCNYSGFQAIPLASVVEFIHTATLLHDDVVDSATLRRGTASANALWGNEASVLIGDFLFSKSFSLMVAAGSLDVLRVMSRATTIIAEGEVLQLLGTGDVDLTEERYIEVVRAKTAVLLSAACQCGAILGCASEQQEQALADFGMELGIAFQLMDDILDYTATQEQFGKSIGHDLEEGKITLPLIHTLRGCTSEEREFVAAIVQQDDELSFDDFSRVSALVQQYGGIDYTIAKARQAVDSCAFHLAAFPDSACKQALLELAEYVVTRNR